MSTTTTPHRTPDAMLTTSEAAELLGLRPHTLHDWRCRGIGPPYHRLGARAVRYRAGDLRAWVEAQRVEAQR